MQSGNDIFQSVQNKIQNQKHTVRQFDISPRSYHYLLTT